MRYRILTVADCTLLLDFYKNLSDEVHELYRPFQEIEDSVIRAHLEETDAGVHLSMGVFDSQRIAGHAFVMRMYDKNPVFGVGLDAAYHGRGYGPILAAEVLTRADRLGSKNIALTVLKRNQKAFRIYRRLGFVVRGEHAYKHKNDSYFMVRTGFFEQIRTADCYTHAGDDDS